MSELRERIERRLRERLASELQSCPECESSSSSGIDTGPLFKHLDEVIEIVAAVQDYSVDPYMDKVRQVVCSACRQKPGGECATRDDGRCALDRFFPIIVAVIEKELRQETF